MEDAHEPGLPLAAPTTPLQADSIVRDTASGERLSVEAWVQRHMRSEGRDRGTALEEVVNAVGRGDLTLE